MTALDITINRSKSHFAVSLGLIFLCVSIFCFESRAQAADNVIEGFQVFEGDCMNRSAPQISPLLLPIIGNLISGGLTAFGGALTEAAKPDSATYLSTVSMQDWSNATKCLHFVYGPIYTNLKSFEGDNTPISDILPLPWELAVKVIADDNKTGDKATEQELKDAYAQVTNSTKLSLVSSGAWLAGKPAFFAEIAIIQSIDKSAIKFKTRALYYGKSLNDGWGLGRKRNSLTLTVGPFDHEKKIEDNLSAGYTINFNNIPSVTSLLFNDYFLELPDDRSTGWESPWYSTSVNGKIKPFTLLAGVIEKRTENKFIGYLGKALTSSATDTAKLITDKLDEAKAKEAENKIKSEESTSRTKAAESVATAITQWSNAKAAYDACANNPNASNWAKFSNARFTALAAITNAKPLIDSSGINIDFLETPTNCPAPSK